MILEKKSPLYDKIRWLLLCGWLTQLTQLSVIIKNGHLEMDEYKLAENVTYLIQMGLIP